MTGAPIRLLARTVAVAVVVFALAAAASLLLDRVNTPVAVVDPGIASVDSTNHSRLLILHIDSWRYETAVDSTLMPEVARLRKQGASWQLETVFEGFTIPAVRAAFSGHDETQLVSLIQNFSFHALPINSFYLDANRLGKRTLVVAQEPWVQFGPYFEQRLPPVGREDMYARDHERPAIALNAYAREAFDVVVCHYESADWVAHETGIHSTRYQREFAYADSLVASFAAARRPNDYLLVYGDHGHSPTGEHKTGISIPTFALLLGPDVRAGVTTRPLAMTNLRYIASHALGITLRAAPYDLAQISQFLPVAGDASPHAATVEARASRAPRDYAMAVAVAIAAALVGIALVRRAGGAGIAGAPLAIVAAALALELVGQQYVRAFALFPFLMIVLALRTSTMRAFERVLVVAVGAFFVMQLLARDGGGSGLTLAPTEFTQLIPLYAFAVVAKLIVLLDGRATTRWPWAVGWTALLALLEFRVWDQPAAPALLFALGAIAFMRGRDAAARRVAAFVMVQTLVYFTLRLPLYQLAWIDLFLGALYLLARRIDDVWIDTLTVIGTFTLTCGWLASGLEWSFLYTIFPAHLVELEVQYFGPFILAKIPLVLVLALVAVGRAPTRRLVAIVFASTALRFAAAWLLRLGGAPGADLWPLVEQGMYLATFVVAAVAWGWHVCAEETRMTVRLSKRDAAAETNSAIASAASATHVTA